MYLDVMFPSKWPHTRLMCGQEAFQECGHSPARDVPSESGSVVERNHKTPDMRRWKLKARSYCTAKDMLMLKIV